MSEVNQEFLSRLVEESKNKHYGKEIVCPYCDNEQSEDTKYSHVSYHGEDSKVKIECENCNKEFWVEEIVLRSFETTTTEWEDKEEARIKKYIEEHK